jgi:hypothetical protein
MGVVFGRETSVPHRPLHSKVSWIAAAAAILVVSNAGEINILETRSIATAPFERMHESVRSVPDADHPVPEPGIFRVRP